jgi:hypothetical protein
MNRKFVGIAGAILAIAGIIAVYTAIANPLYGYGMPMMGGMGYGMPYGMMGYGMPMMGRYGAGYGGGYQYPGYPAYGYQNTYPNPNEALNNETLPQYPQYPQNPYPYYGYGHCPMMGW